MADRKTKAQIAALLTAQYPRIHRLANGLCGDFAAAAAVTRTVLIQSLAVVQRWRSELEGENWFFHHTILIARQTKPNWNLAAGAEPELAAFAKAYGALPSQQREAFVLAHGEKLDLRRTAIAMDCSKTAAGNHLAAAEAALKSIAGIHYERLVGALLAIYATPPAAPDVVIGYAVRAGARRRVWRRTLAVVLLVATGAAVWIGWRIYHMLDY